MLTGTHSEAASYEFTTLTCIPGIIHYNDTKIQLLDLPGIIEGASEGKGRGRQVKIWGFWSYGVICVVISCYESYCFQMREILINFLLMLFD